jgi:hypothetical protein
MIRDQMLVDVPVIGQVFVTDGAFDWWFGAHITPSGPTSKSHRLAISLISDGT